MYDLLTPSFVLCNSQLFCLFYQNKLQGRSFTLFTFQQTLFTSDPSLRKVSSDEGTEFCCEVLLDWPQFPSEGEAEQLVVGVGDGAITHCEVQSLPGLTGNVKTI